MQRKSIDYQAMWEKCEQLSWCALVTTGRVGTDFFQSLLDSHPEILVFNGILFFHEFWNNSPCTRNFGGIDSNDIVDAFIGHHIEKLKSKYDLQERKNELGPDRNMSIDIDINQFRTHLLNLISFRPVSSKNFLTAVYIAYSICLGQDVMKKKLFFHHVHHIWKLDRYLQDFPESKILSMTRDPRATYVSGVEHWRRFSPATDHPGHVFFVLNRTIQDAQPLRKYSNNFMVLRLEDTGSYEILSKVCEWIGISYNQCMEKSTWGGMKWWGDRLSQKRKLESENGFSPSITMNNWENKLPVVDKALLSYLLMDRLRWYKYEYKNKSGLLYDVMMFVAILLPTTYECRFLTLKWLLLNLRDRQYKRVATSFYYYTKRISLYYKLYFKKHFGEKFNVPYFKLGER